MKKNRNCVGFFSLARKVLLWKLVAVRVGPLARIFLDNGRASANYIIMTMTLMLMLMIHTQSRVHVQQLRFV